MEGGGGAAAPGLNLLPVETRFAAQKQTHQTRVRLADGTCMSGYEIHMGETILDRGTRAFSTIVERQGCKVDLPDGAISADGQIWGTYLHGLFANTDFRRQWLTDLGWKEPETVQTKAEDADCDRLADVVAEAIDWSHLMRIMDIR